MKELKIGQRVRVRNRKYNCGIGPRPKMVGTVICNTFIIEYGVEFDEPFDGGHNSSGNGKRGHCWNFSPCPKQEECKHKIPGDCGYQPDACFCCLEPAYNWVKMK